MLNIKECESKNIATISGILKELDVEEKTTSDNREYVSCKATIKVDQEINGKMTENEIPIRMFAMKYKKDGTANKIYAAIAKYKEEFTSLASCPEDHPEMASKVAVSNARIEENIWIGQDGEAKTGFQITSNFLNKPRGEFEMGSTFELSGVVLNKTRETDVNGDETGRLKIKFAVVRFGGKVDVLNLIAASDNAVNFIENNWEDGDTVSLNGAISFNQATKVWFEDQGFGAPVKRTKTETRKELIILGGCPSGLEEAYAYDANDIKNALAERQARVEDLKTKKKPTTSSKNVNQFGF